MVLKLRIVDLPRVAAMKSSTSGSMSEKSHLV
jgi:hypothetical protein